MAMLTRAIRGILYGYRLSRNEAWLHEGIRDLDHTNEDASGSASGPRTPGNYLWGFSRGNVHLSFQSLWYSIDYYY